MKSITPYPSITPIDPEHRRIWSCTGENEKDNYRYYIEEKIDGSQMSILVTSDGRIQFYNKNKLIDLESSVFRKDCMMLIYNFDNKSILNPNYIYHGEAVCDLRHNVITYNRTPKYYYIIYDIFDTTSRTYLSPEAKQLECQRIGLDCVPILYYNSDQEVDPIAKCIELIEQIEELKLESILGGIPEGVVLKHHAFYKGDKMSATKLKMVSEKFKERHTMRQSKVKLNAEEFIKGMGTCFATEARFHKAFQHLCESGDISKEKMASNDINKLVKELDHDFDKEYEEELMLTLWTEFSPIIKKYAREGAGVWFKEKSKELYVVPKGNMESEKN